MCTVTYIPTESGYILTSSRDERITRETIKPKQYEHGHQLLVYPKDIVKSGTWIASSNKAKVACLLNGGFVKHEKLNENYKSRGKILLESFNFDSFESFYEATDLRHVEPFTMLCLEDIPVNNFYQMVWDGKQKHLEEINANTPGIWSSSTLYSEYEKLSRENWFGQWIKVYGYRSDRNIFNFHAIRHAQTEILLQLKGGLQTVSISQIIGDSSEFVFKYKDLMDESFTELIQPLNRCTPVLR